MGVFTLHLKGDLKMLREIQHVLDNPDDVPGIPEATAQYLKVRLNPAYLMRTGVTDDFQKAGWSEQKILGFLEGVSSVVELIEFMDEAQHQVPETEDEPNVLRWES